MTFKLTVDNTVWNELKSGYDKADTYNLNLGWFEENVYGPDNHNLPMATVAQLAEEGHINGPTAHIPGAVTPPRPYMRVGLAAAVNEGQVQQQFDNMIKAVATGKSVLTAMQQTAPFFVRTLKKVMNDWDDPANSPLTIKLKGFDDPLRNTGQLIDNITAKVEPKGDS